MSALASALAPDRASTAAERGDGGKFTQGVHARLLAYESDQLTPDQAHRLFQELIDSGLAWSLRGHYGRHVARLSEAGHCRPAEERRR